MPASRQWWHDAVIYQVYLRSFADGTGDGIGDLAGLAERLPYLVDLGVDAVWITPWYPSPMADGGYDVADFRDIDPLFGTLDDADTLLAAAHAAGLRVIIDLPANHTSDSHPWFREALRSAPGSRERARYFFRPGRGDTGELPPNDWISAFGGPAWTRTTRDDGQAGQWYLHLFAPEQPDLDWTNPEVRTEFADVLRFWFDRGVDGIRIDAVSAMAKVPGLPDAGHAPGARFESSTWVDNPHWDVDELHDILREFRAIADEYGPDRMFVAEAIVRSPERLARYVRPGELHTAFNFDFPRAGWDPTALREAVDRSREALREVGAPTTWVLSSHDETRHLTRFGRAETSTLPMTLTAATDSDLTLGTRRARAAVLLMLGLPGGAYLYQGEELGLEEVTDLPTELLQDPTWERSGHTIRGRDGCRVPLPWSGDHPPFGFAADDVRPWLPQPDSWKSKTVVAESDDPDSMLTLYRTALRLRRTLPALRDDSFSWQPSPPDTLAFDRGTAFRCVVNLSHHPIAIDPDATVLLASTDLNDAPSLPPDTAVWLRTSR
ncbi:alpha-glucosidase/amylase family protein [Rhodococcus ruber BKS 20-38]|uniref:Alpha-glucosidase/amylase family protein n=1 Tax=Rhodococcus ruber BKS 20-38 TaxID=1278076 RepID=M3A1D7_9NOCA|nr:glycoside hydrolase family 13 protein [Rhodococcus ruber]EME66359.1 alpha-glucosidase/amylase family protein [Rhodococcus ruber BKS 20-38]